MLFYHDDIKYIVARQWEWKLIGDFHPAGTFDTHWYALEKRPSGWWIVAKVGCGWDGATWFPDFKWTMQASLGHDILHWLIAKRIIPESENDLIDREMCHIIKDRGKGYERLLRFRAWYIKKGISLVNQKAGVPVHTVKVA